MQIPSGCIAASLQSVDNLRPPPDNDGMNVTLPTPLAEFVRHKVAAGEFHSPDEMVCEGLRLLQQREQWKSDARSKIDVGWEQAKKGQLLSPRQLRANLSSRKAAWHRRTRNTIGPVSPRLY